MNYVIAHDLGTSGNKATLFDENGKLVASEVYAYSTAYFNDTWVEQDPEDWWKAICITSKSLIEKSGVKPGDIAVVSFSGQMMGCLCVDRQGEPLRKSIIWADQRAQKQAEAIEREIPLSEFYRITGHRNTASYGLQKLMWVRDNEPEIYQRTYKTLNAKDFIIYRLTGQFLTEPSDATSVNCMQLTTLQWSRQILDCAKISMDKLPDIVPSTHVAGKVTKEAAALTGLQEGTAVVMGGGDGVCANVGAGSVRVGKTFSYVGSSAWIASTSEQPLFDKNMQTITWAHIVPGLYAPNGTMQCAGGSYNWLKTQICRQETEQAETRNISPYEIINAEIATSPIGSNGVIFLPYLLGERAPRWNPNAKACFLGLKMQNRREDLLRSVLEGVTMNLAIILDALRQALTIDEILVIGGGAKGAVWCQMMADIYQVQIKAPVLLEEATSMGAALTGGVGVGLYRDFDEIERFIQIKQEYAPNPEAAAAYAPIRACYEQCYRDLIDVFDRMSAKFNS